MTAWTLRCLTAASSAAFCLLSLPSLAAPPEPAPTPAPTEIAVPVLPAEPMPAPAPASEPTGEAFRIVEGPQPAPAPAPMPEATIVVPTPVVDPAPVACPSPAVRSISKRPSVGTGLMVAGAGGLAWATVMVVLATVGRNEAGLTNKQTIPIGLSAIPIAGLGAAAMIGGIKANQKYNRWVDENDLDAPAPGNGMLVAGVVLSSVGAVTMGFAIDHNRRAANPDMGDRALTGVSAATLASGVMLLGGGVIQRSRFSAWEGVGYIRPGFYAGREGGGVAISGRF